MNSTVRRRFPRGNSCGRFQHRTKRGSTLYEVLVYGSLTSMLLTASVTGLHRMRQAQRRIEQEQQASAEVWRLANCLRDDAAVCSSARVGENGHLIFALPEGRRIEYAEQDRSSVLLRQEFGEGDVVVQRERFRFPYEAKLSWDIDGQRLQIDITRPQVALPPVARPHAARPLAAAQPTERQDWRQLIIALPTEEETR